MTCPIEMARRRMSYRASCGFTKSENIAIERGLGTPEDVIQAALEGII